uniref:Soluble calcium-activated nucleotidase 1 n=1 Tax=Panagrellus redivivus TaxID=6233 RepID=A0A7E4V2W3_PANRE
MATVVLLQAFFAFISVSANPAILRSSSFNFGFNVPVGSQTKVEVKNVRPYNTSKLYTITTRDNHLIVPVVAITDQDADSVVNGSVWYSTYLQGYVQYSQQLSQYSMQWQQSKNFTGSLAFANRGMELSELHSFDGNLITVDDKTGVVYKIRGNDLIPWLIESDGDGESPNFFKAEWMTVKDENLYIGGQGYEYVSPNGSVQSTDTMWIKIVTRFGETTSVNWYNNYLKVRESIGIRFPGYVTHEAVQWSDIHQRWFFLPRRVSTEPYNSEANEFKGSNYLIIADETFDDIQSVRIGDVEPSRGFSTFQFLPETDDNVIIALKTEELLNGTLATYTCIFAIDGTVFFYQQIAGHLKLEGLEFANFMG